MLKKVLVSVALGSLLLFSLSLWAKTKQEPIQVAAIAVENQLSISAHQAGKEDYLQQVTAPKTKAINPIDESNLPVSVISVFWTMAFGLLFFVIKATRRIK
jgi:hypothetical protein